MFSMIWRAFVKKKYPLRYAKSIGVQFGSNCRFINTDFGSEPWLIKIGDHVSISDTQFVNHDGGAWVARIKEPYIEYIEPIVIGSNVFIGSGVIILPGTVIGDNVVVGAGAVVKGVVTSGSVVGGVPARTIGNYESYVDKILAEGEKTKNLSSKDKCAYYTAKFGEVNHEINT